jgi:hypothetical protein
MIIHPRFLFAVVLLASPLVHAQAGDPAQSPVPQANQPAAPESFLVTLTLKTTDHAKKSTDQSYTMAVMTHAGSSNVREGDRIPIVTGMDGGKSQVQYVDAGTNIDLVNVKRVGTLVAIDVKVEISGVVPETAGKADPTLRQTTYSVNPVVPVGKQITVYSSTDAVSGRKVDIQILVEPIPTA